MNEIQKKRISIQFNVRTYTMIAALIILWIVFTITTNSSFILPRNMSNLVRQMSIVGIMGTGMVLVIVSGGIDLSVGSIMGFLGCAAAALQVWAGWNTFETILVVVIGGAIIGYLQGILVAHTGVPPFIITLGGQLIFRGGVLAVTRGTTVAPLQKDFLDIGQSNIDKTLGIAIVVAAILFVIVQDLLEMRSRKRITGNSDSMGKTLIRWVVMAVLLLFSIFYLNAYRGLPTPVLLMVVLVIIFSFIAEKTTFGRRVYAIGGNIDAAKYSGINVKRNITMVYVLNGLMAAIAGVVLAARLNAGTATAGINLELDAIAAAVIGGTSMSGGSGKVAGAILGALIMATIDNGMSMMNMEAFWQYIVKGLILIAAVWFDVRTQSKGKS
jgi:D-xylose transport system permease protein